VEAERSAPVPGGAAGAAGGEAVPLVFAATVPWVGRLDVEETPCLLCGRHDARPVQRCVLNGRTLRTVRCVHDGMLWLDPRPAPAFYARLYAEHYYGVGPDDPLFEQASLPVPAPPAQQRVVAGWRMDEIERGSLPGRVPGRLLEVGFGAGHVLREARARGWTVFGLEEAQPCVDAARAAGLPAARASLLTWDGPDGALDAVALYSVLEHLLDPRAHLRRARALLRPGGVLALRLPDTPPAGPPASLIAHVYHFNHDTIGVLLRDEGFRVVHLETAGTWRPTRYPGELPNMNVVARTHEATGLVAQ
jgi:SAM-dependent methyltransferase